MKVSSLPSNLLLLPPCVLPHLPRTRLVSVVELFRASHVYLTCQPPPVPNPSLSSKNRPVFPPQEYFHYLHTPQPSSPRTCPSLGVFVVLIHTPRLQNSIPISPSPSYTSEGASDLGVQLEREDWDDIWAAAESSSNICWRPTMRSDSNGIRSRQELLNYYPGIPLSAIAAVESQIHVHIWWTSHDHVFKMASTFLN